MTQLIQCPECKNPGITISAWAPGTVTLDKEGQLVTVSGFEDTQWDECESAWCEECGWEGLLSEAEEDKHDKNP